MRAVNEFEVGDRVRIRDWDDMANEYGLDEDGDIQCELLFTREMREFCGRECVVTDIGLFGNITLDDPETQEYSITSDMLELQDEKADLAEFDEAGFLEVLN